MASKLKATTKRSSVHQARAASAKVKEKGSRSSSLALLIGTRKGAFLLNADARRSKWTVSKPLFLGHIVYHMIADPRNSNVVVMASKTRTPWADCVSIIRWWQDVEGINTAASLPEGCQK